MKRGLMTWCIICGGIVLLSLAIISVKKRQATVPTTTSTSAPSSIPSLFGGRVKIPKATTQSTGRFSVDSYGYFSAGYGNNSREIIIILDNETGKKYLGITGVGITELLTKDAIQSEE